MKICIITPLSQNIEPYVEVFEKKGIHVQKNSASSDCDFIIGSGQAYIGLWEYYHNYFPHIPMINITLDFYKTVWSAPNPHGYDWKKYKHFLNKCVELWCISNEVIVRMSEEGVDTDKCKLMKIWARFFEYAGPITDERYILKTIRPYIADKNYGWLERACKELQIPLKSPNHGASEEQYQKLLAECSFMCTDYHETSTGGLGLLEGYKLGKVSVISDSLYEGAQDYLGDRAIYFDDNNYEDFKRVIKQTLDNTPKLDIEDCRAFCNSHPTIEDNVDFMIDRMKSLKRGESF